MPTNAWNKVREYASLTAIFMAVIVSSVACAAVTAIGAPEPGEAAYSAGLTALDRGDYEQAIAQFTLAIELEPNLAQAHLARGEANYIAGDYELAISDFSNSLEADYRPAAQAYSARADAFIAAGDYARGSNDYSAAYAHDDGYVRRYYPQRVAAYSNVILLYPELAAARFARGLANNYVGDKSASLEDLSTAIELQHTPISPAYYYRAWHYFRLGLAEEAAADFTSAIQFDPTSAEAYADRAYPYLMLRQYDKAFATLMAAVEIDPGFARGHNNLCWFGSLMGRVTEIADSCEQAVLLQPDTPAFHDSRGLARALTGNYAGAIEDFRIYIQAMHAHGLEAADREFWVAELQAGRNPFDDSMLAEMLAKYE